MMPDRHIKLIFFGIISTITSDYFYGGSITWRLADPLVTGSPISVIVTQTYTFYSSSVECTDLMIASNAQVNYSGLVTKQLQCVLNCRSVSFSNINVIPNCIGNSWTFYSSITQRLDRISLTDGDDFSIAYQDGPWQSLTTNSKASWSLVSRINLTKRPNGLYNNAPFATMMSPIYVMESQKANILIPTADIDNDDVRCRWADSTNGIDECADVCPPGSLPSGTTIYPNCTLIITGGAASDWYVVAIMVEDFIDSRSKTPLSSVPVQFLVSVTSTSSCTATPELEIKPLVDPCMTVIVGTNFTFQITSTISCNKIEPDIVVQTLFSVTQTETSNPSSHIYSKNITWKPTQEQLGYQFICAMIADDKGVRSSVNCYKFYVSETALPFCPNITLITTNTSTTETSEPDEAKLYRWLVIGLLTGIPLLLTFALSGCLLWYYYGRTKLSDRRYNFSSSSKFRNEINPIKPKHVTVVTLPHSNHREPLHMSDFIRRMPDYERTVDSTQIRHYNWYQQWTINQRY